MKAGKEVPLKKAGILDASPDDSEKFIPEARVDQIAPEIQNEELRMAQEGIEGSCGRDKDFYDFSPVGYFIFNQAGKILDANLTGASLVGQDRSIFLNEPFTLFLDEMFRPVFREHLQAVLKSRRKERSELKLIWEEGRPVFISMESVSIKEEEKIRVRSAVSDIPNRKKAEEEILRLNAELEAKVTEGMAQVEDASKALKEEIAERVRAEEEIRQSEREFRGIFALSSVGMAQRDGTASLSFF